MLTLDLKPGNVSLKLTCEKYLTNRNPDILKKAKVLPLHKGGPSHEVNNYLLPVSLLSIFDKIIEKMKLYEFIEQHNILFKNQFGFRKNNTYALTPNLDTM